MSDEARDERVRAAYEQQQRDKEYRRINDEKLAQLEREKADRLAAMEEARRGRDQ